MLGTQGHTEKQLQNKAKRLNLSLCVDNLQTVPDLMNFLLCLYVYRRSNHPIIFHKRLKDLEIWEQREREGGRE